MNYDASVQTLACPFCGSEKVEEQKQTRTLAAKSVIPFEVDQTRAQGILRHWLGASFWRPSDLAKTAVVEKLTRVFVPYWAFSANTFTYWTADSSQTPPGARGDWVPMFGHHRSHYDDVLIGASSVLSPQETHALCPFDLSKGKPKKDVPMDGIINERFVVQRKYARPLARQSIEQLERQACDVYVPARSRNVKVNVRLEGLQSTPILLPVWIMAYRYKGEIYRFLVNGQNGQHTGSAPFSYMKLMMILGGVGLVALLIGLMIICAGAIGMR